MPMFDLPLHQLEMYRPPREEAADFDAFWQMTLAEARSFPVGAQFVKMQSPLRLVDTYDLTFRGFGGQPIKGWLLVPRGQTEPVPCVVEYIGYGGGRGHVIDWLLWSSAGYAHLVMDTRGQGSMSRRGDTPDFEVEPSNPQTPGFMTRGILNPRTYYYRRLMTDAVRAVEAARSFPQVDASRIAVTGGSQGGGLALAVAGLEPSVGATMADVPFLCHYRVATEIEESAPYNEIARFCRVHRDRVDTVFRALSYFDGVNFAARASCPALFSVGLMDEICPPRTVYAAYNHYAGPKSIRVYPYNHHEGGETYQAVERLNFIGQLWPTADA